MNELKVIDPSLTGVFEKEPSSPCLGIDNENNLFWCCLCLNYLDRIIPFEEELRSMSTCAAWYAKKVYDESVGMTYNPQTIEIIRELTPEIKSAIILLKIQLI